MVGTSAPSRLRGIDAYSHWISALGRFYPALHAAQRPSTIRPAVSSDEIFGSYACEKRPGEPQEGRGALFYEFSLEQHVPIDRLLKAMDRFFDLGAVRAHMAPFYSTMGRGLRSIRNR